MTEPLDLLFGEFAARHARGEHPDAGEYLARAGERRDELARALDAFLAAAPVQPPSERTRALFASLVAAHAQTSPLLAERVRRGWRRSDVVAWIRERFAIPEEKEEKVEGYWHEVENGLRPLARLSAELRAALAELFGEAFARAEAWQPAPLPARSFRREPDRPDLLEPGIQLKKAMPAAPAPEPDDVDRLFGAS